LNIVEVFQKEVIKTTEQAMNHALDKLKKDDGLKRKFRELDDIQMYLE